MNLAASQPSTNGTEFGQRRFAADVPARPGPGLDLVRLLPDAWVGGAYASSGPEVRQLTFGILPLTDCAPIAVAHETGLFKKYGIESSITKFASWTASRDSL